MAIRSVPPGPGLTPSCSVSTPQTRPTCSAAVCYQRSHCSIAVPVCKPPLLDLLMSPKRKSSAMLAIWV